MFQTIVETGIAVLMFLGLRRLILYVVGPRYVKDLGESTEQLSSLDADVEKIMDKQARDVVRRRKKRDPS